MTTKRFSPRTKPGFSTEAALVARLLSELRSKRTPWGDVQTATEWDYRTGITDVLARDAEGLIVAFEAKLKDWRRASHQAYRNTVFAGQAYVVMPESAANRALLSIGLFQKYGVGLCAIGDDCVRILIEAKKNEPLIPWLRDHAHAHFDKITRRHSTRHRPRSERVLPTAECVA